MKSSILTSVLLAGVFSTAAAKPTEDAPSGRVSYVDDAPAEPAADWVEIASPTPCAHGRTFVTVAAEAPFTQLRIAAHSGRPVLQTVKVVYTDGTKKVVKLTKRQLSNGKPAFIPVSTSKQIDMIVVDTDHRAKGSYTISGAPQRDAVARR